MTKTVNNDSIFTKIYLIYQIEKEKQKPAKNKSYAGKKEIIVVYY
jgi:hypothetical protein